MDAWRQLYCREDGTFAAMSCEARMLHALAVKYADDAGRLVALPGEGPNDVALRVFRVPTRNMRRIVGRALAELLEEAEILWRPRIGLQIPGFWRFLEGGEPPLDYGPGWAKARKAALERDGFRCQACAFAGQLDVHHRIPLREFTTSDEANRLENLVSLCRACHAIAEAAYRATGAVFGEDRS